MYLSKIVLLFSLALLASCGKSTPPAPKDALNNSFPGVLRLGYFSDGANLS